MLGSMSTIDWTHIRKLAVTYLVQQQQQILKQWHSTLRAYGEVGIPDTYHRPRPITRFDRLLAAHSTVPTECVPVRTEVEQLADLIERHVFKKPKCAECGSYMLDRMYVDREASKGTTIHFTIETCRTCVGRGRP